MGSQVSFCTDKVARSSVESNEKLPDAVDQDGGHAAEKTPKMDDEPAMTPAVDREGPQGSRKSGLAQVEWREYSITLKWFFHPYVMVIICVQNTFYMVNTVIPNISWLGFVLTYCMAIFPSRPWYAVVVAMTGIVPRWATIFGGVLFAVLSAAAWYTKRTGTIGLVVGMVVWTALVFKWVKKRCFMLAFVVWLLFVQSAIVMILTYHHKIVEVFGLEGAAAGLVLPAAAAMYSGGGFTTMCWILNHCDTEGVPNVVFSLFVCVVVGTTQILQLSGLVEAAKYDDIGAGLKQMAVTVVVATAGDIWKRAVLSGRFLSALTGGKFPCVINAERDVFIRSGYFVDFTVLPSYLFIGVWCFATEVPFAQRPVFWISFPIFVLMSLFSDLVMFMIHRIYYPVKNETYMQTVLRLQMPGQNFPALQIDEGGRFEHYKETGQFRSLEAEARNSGRVSQHDTSIWRAKWSQHPILHDELVCIIGFMVLMANMSRISFTAFFGQCGITVAEHLCADLYGAEQCNAAEQCGAA